MLSVTMEIELKAIIRLQQQVIQTRVLKYNQILLAASHGKTSPYNLSPDELNDLASALMKEKSILLSTNLDLTKCLVSIQNNSISFIIQIPILDHQKHTFKWLQGESP